MCKYVYMHGSYTQYKSKQDKHIRNLESKTIPSETSLEHPPHSPRKCEAGWWFQTCFYFHPDPWGDDPISLILFKGVETTNQEGIFLW